MKYWVDGDRIRFAGTNLSGYFVPGSGTTQEQDYLAWVAEGNTADQWQPDTPTTDESTASDVE